MDTQSQLFEEGITTISKRGFADMVGVSEGLIRKYLHEGKLTADCEVTLANGWKALDEAKAYKQWQELKGAADIAPAASQGGETEELNRAREETLLTIARRKEVELRLMEAEGHLHHADDVRAVMNDMVARFRARVRAIPAKLAPVLAMETDPAQVQLLLTRETDEALQELSDYDAKAIKKASRQRRGAAVTSGE